jgi:hypothetical protein
MDLFPTDLTKFHSVDNALDSSFLVAQPGDHALRIEPPTTSGLLNRFIKRLWDIAGGSTSFQTKSIDILTVTDIEDSLDFKFHRYATAVVELDRLWRILSGSTVEWAKERVFDKIPDHIEERDRDTLRMIEGLLHMLWFKPPYEQLQPIEQVYEELESEPTPTETQQRLVPALGELAYSLTDIIEKAKYLKWKSVIDRKSFSKSDVFKGLDLTNIEREAFAVALEDILKEHTLSYIGYPEQATMKNKVMRVLLGSVILPVRLFSSFMQTVRTPIFKFLERKRTKQEEIEVEENTEEPESST